MRRTVVAAGLVGLLVLGWLLMPREHGRTEERPDGARSADAAPVPTRDVATGDDVAAERSDAARDSAALDLRDASPTFRNSTLLFAIRRAGFDCADVVSAHESVEGVWLASCSDVIIYIVSLRGAEQFDVHQVEYRDSVVPAPVDRDRLPEPRSLEPQPLR